MKQEMMEKHRKVIPPSPGGASTSAVTEELNELVPTAEAGGTQPVELQPVAVPESRDERQEVIAQSTPTDRLIKGMEAASAETLRAVARDVLAITTLTDQVSGELMEEIELLNGSLIETQVAIVSPESGWLASEAGDETTLACAFRAVGSAASE